MTNQVCRPVEYLETLELSPYWEECDTKKETIKRDLEITKWERPSYKHKPYR